jgi:diguanylate cyclase (GGDEF)-like protein
MGRVGFSFLVLKLERDRFHAEKDTLKSVAEHDPLTGLYNRRAVDLRFDALRKDGFDTLALVDLDRFKDINDRYGHLVGDAVLEACGRSLAESDKDCVAIRLGGEEFVVMLRGPHTVQRAEALRQAIARRVAADVPDLGRLVTASMGVLELPRRASDMMSFEEIYARADKLLYEAKTTGRNRMLYEKLPCSTRRAARGRPRRRET